MATVSGSSYMSGANDNRPPPMTVHNPTRQGFNAMHQEQHVRGVKNVADLTSAELRKRADMAERAEREQAERAMQMKAAAEAAPACARVPRAQQPVTNEAVAERAIVPYEAGPMDDGDHPCTHTHIRMSVGGVPKLLTGVMIRPTESQTGYLSQECQDLDQFAAHERATMRVASSHRSNMKHESLSHRVLERSMMVKFQDTPRGYTDAVRQGHDVALPYFNESFFPPLSDYLPGLRPDCANVCEIIDGTYDPVIMQKALRRIYSAPVCDPAGAEKTPVIIRALHVVPVSSNACVEYGIDMAGTWRRVGASGSATLHSDISYTTHATANGGPMPVKLSSCSPHTFATYAAICPDIEEAAVRTYLNHPHMKGMFDLTPALSFVAAQFFMEVTDRYKGDQTAAARYLEKNGLQFSPQTGVTIGVTPDGLTFLCAYLKNKRSQIVSLPAGEMIMAITPICSNGWAGLAAYLALAEGTSARDEGGRTVFVAYNVTTSYSLPKSRYHLRQMISSAYEAEVARG